MCAFEGGRDDHTVGEDYNLITLDKPQNNNGPAARANKEPVPGCFPTAWIRTKPYGQVRRDVIDATSREEMYLFLRTQRGTLAKAGFGFGAEVKASSVVQVAPHLGKTCFD